MRNVDSHSRGVSRYGILVVILSATWTSISIRSADAAPDDPKQDAPASTSARDARAGAGIKSDTWRYRRHDGLWWYWTVADRWVYWVDDHWVDYDPKTQARRTIRKISSSEGWTARRSAVLVQGGGRGAVVLGRWTLGTSKSSFFPALGYAACRDPPMRVRAGAV